ncbi:MAG: hypothetical protein ABIC91_01650 [Nanoarchaeota archaeon]|nr:hypothetical protein [Nanoarchaeota archaeon]MBU1030578.1 hypothetical protein [Nanoarchaeota archaeon]MBU1849378.1 hypothetical protein [Nanoarchaeota archaeon]
MMLVILLVSGCYANQPIPRRVVEPGEPGTPIEPVEPNEPGTPIEPEEPSEPGTPIEPVEPNEPGDSLATMQAVLEMLNNCEPSGQYLVYNENSSAYGFTGNSICGNQICIFGYGGIVIPNTDYFNYDVNSLLACNAPLEYGSGVIDYVEGAKLIAQYYCCSP